VAIRIPIIADVVDAIRGARNLGESFDDVADALGDVDHAADDASGGARKMDSAFQDVAGALGDVDHAAAGIAEVGDQADAAKRDADGMEKSFREAFDSVRKESKSAADGVGSIKEGTAEASEGVKEFGREARRRPRKRSAASFDGSADSIAGSFQELAANAFAGFGPAGAVAGLAAAAGIGIVTSKMEEAKEKAQETAEQVAEIAGELIDLGDTHLGSEQVLANLKEMASTAEDGKIPLEELRTLTERAGISYTDYAQGIAGDSDALQGSYDEVQHSLQDYQEGLDKVDAKYGHNSEQSLKYRKGVQDQVQALLEARDAILEQDAALGKGTTAAQDYADAAQGITVVTDEQAAAHERTAARIQEASDKQAAYNEVLKTTADPVSVYTDLLSQKEAAERKTAEETAAATKSSSDSWEDYATDVTVTTADLIAEWNKQAEENAAFADNLAKIGAAGGQALADEMRAKGPEVAGATAAAIAQADPATMQAAIDAHGRATGSAIVTAMGAGIVSNKTGLQTAVDQTAAGIVAPSVGVKVTPDMTALERELSKVRTIQVDIRHRVGEQVAI
jgi:hypothetical protein